MVRPGNLEVVRGSDGIFRDVNERPMVMIFSTKEKRDKPMKNSDSEPNAGFQPLTWIDASDSSSKDKSTRKIIRTHVMKHHKRQHISSHQNLPRSVKTSRKLTSLPTFPPFQQPSGSLDPFTAYPIPMKPRTYKLLHRYLSVIIQASYPSEFDWRGGNAGCSLFELAMHDSALFHMILCSSALYVDVQKGNLESQEALYHKVEAIHEVNRRLQHGPDMSNAIIGTVSYLAKIEVKPSCHVAGYNSDSAKFVLGNQEMWLIHMKGLVQMIELRGGFDILSRGLQKKTCMPGVTNSLGPEPNFPQLIVNAIDPSATEVTTLELGNEFEHIIDQFSLSEPFLIIFKDVRRFSQLAFKSELQQTNFALEIDTLTSEVRNRLFSSVREDSTQMIVIRECCRLGALTYLKALLDLTPYQFTAKEILLQKLKFCLEHLEALILGDEVAELVIWLLFICGFAKSDNKIGAWFIERLPDVAGVLRKATLEGVKQLLMKFLWLHQTHEGLIAAFWNEFMSRKNIKQDESKTVHSVQHTE